MVPCGLDNEQFFFLIAVYDNSYCSEMVYFRQRRKDALCVCTRLCVCPGLAGGEMDEMGREEEKWATEEGMKDEGR